jgi:uncharacterized protein DUF2877
MRTRTAARPAAASLAVRGLLDGEPRAGRVVAVFPRAVYAEVAGRLVSVETADALRLPCAVVLADSAHDRPLACVHPRDPVRAGGRRLQLGDLTLDIVRWWAPAKPRGAVPGDARGATRRTAGRWDRLVLGLLGLGPGLTPAGDDLLAGLLAGLAGRPDLRGPLADAVDRHAAARTTWLSAELLRLAADGLVAPAVAAVADALAGHGGADAVAKTLPALLAVGHTSGPALARGLLLAAETSLAHPSDAREAA